MDDFKPIDHNKIKDGQKIFNGQLYDSDDKLLGPVPRIEVEDVDPFVEAKIKMYLEEDIPSPFPKTLSWEEIRVMKMPQNRWRIENLIPFEGFVILAAISGEKKTWVAMEMARCIASGEKFLGKFNTIPGNVLYIDEEMSLSELQKRGKQLQLSSEKNKLLFINQSGLNLNEDRSVEWLLKYIEDNQICTIVIDTFRAVAGGMEENKAEEVRKFFNRLKVLKNKGVSVIILDHFKKPNHFEGKIPKKEHLFASQDKAASVEVLIMLKSEEGNIINVYQRKNRLAKEMEPFAIHMDDELDENMVPIKTTLTFAQLEEYETKKEEAREAILDLLFDKGMYRQEILDAIYSERSIGTKNISDALREMTKRGEIMVEKQGKQNFFSLLKEKIPEKETLEDQSGIFDSS